MSVQETKVKINTVWVEQEGNTQEIFDAYEVIRLIKKENK